ncbi:MULTISPECIES: hypothetical protein [Streptomyces]|uniref:hypothetical protein n=1 Tax=Streptomyces TaxID=1883 RepID=UPI00136D303F|nr:MULTISPECIES: hypothetical protein [Streptomyces]MCX5271985.1 hypothetical protein [Streptomyces virginiae]MYV77050.1 hypothetical protein [Streptomyces sp. SID1046]
MKRQRSFGSRARAPAVLVAGLLLLGAPSAYPLSRDGTRDPTAPCVSTPAEYRAAWEAREVRCVAPSLFGTTHARGQTSPYPSGFRYAWAAAYGFAVALA